MNDKKLLDRLKSAPRTQESKRLHRRMETLFADHKATRAALPWRAPLTAGLLCLWTIASISVGITWGRTNAPSDAPIPPATRVEIIHHHNTYNGSAFDIAQTRDAFFGPPTNATIEYAVEVSAEPSTDLNNEENLKLLGYLE